MTRGIRTLIFALVVVSVGMAICHTTAATDESTSAITGKYLLVFNDRDCNLPGVVKRARDRCTQPKFSRVHLLQSDDGATWRSVPGFEPFPGGVPDAVRRGNTLYIYANLMNPNPALGGIGLRVRKYHFDTDTWDDPVCVELAGGRGPYPPRSLGARFPEQEFPIEESVIIDDDGRIVLFYVLGYEEDELRGQCGFTEYVRSATEVEGSDGTKFTVDEGDRFTLTACEENEAVSLIANVEVFRGPYGYIMYAGFLSPGETGGGVGILALESMDLHGGYRPVQGLPDGILAKNVAAHPGGYYDAAAEEYWTFTVPARPEPKDVILRAVHNRIDRPLSGSQFRTVVELENVPGSERTFIDGADGGIWHPRFAVNEPFPGTLMHETESTTGTSSDRDGDGVPDDQDYCPDYPGKPEANGC